MNKKEIAVRDFEVGNVSWFDRFRLTGALLLLASAPWHPAFAEEGIREREMLTGDWGGARSALQERGIEIGIEHVGETFSVLSGGLQRGTSFEGLLDVSVDTDLEKLRGWKGASTHIRAFQIHNADERNAADLAGSISDPSNIDALRTSRLFTA